MVRFYRITGVRWRLGCKFELVIGRHTSVPGGSRYSELRRYTSYSHISAV